LVVNIDQRTFERSEKLTPLNYSPVSGTLSGTSLIRSGESMCEQCKNLQKQIDQFTLLALLPYRQPAVPPPPWVR